MMCLSEAESGSPSVQESEDADRAADTLIGFVRDQPDATYTGQSVRDIAVDEANDLEGCGDEGPPLAKRIDRVLRNE